MGSLQLALTLLPLLAGVLFLGTLMESWHSRKAAVDLVYGTWWFALLLVLLGVNVTFAAVKKWPWARYQTGFLITHLGLITLVLGGLASTLAGVTGVVMLIDDPDGEAPVGSPSVASEAYDDQAFLLRVFDAADGREALFAAPVGLGPAPWRMQDEAGALPWLTRALIFAAHPGRRSWQSEIEPQTRLAILDYQPRAREELYPPADAEERAAAPACELELTSSAAGIHLSRWVTGFAKSRSVRIGPGLVEFAGHDWSEEKCQAFVRADEPLDAPAGVLARLQLAMSLEGKLYFRAFARPSGRAEAALVRMAGGTLAEESGWQAIWPTMHWRARLVRLIPRASERSRYVSAADVLGEGGGRYTSAIHCRMTRQDDAQEFWVAESRKLAQAVRCGGKDYFVSLGPRIVDLPFQLRLLHVEQSTDPGSGLPAGQTSQIELDDPPMGVHRQAHTISFNEPLAYRGYRIYQAGFQSLGINERGRAVHQSVLRVTLDPGLQIKYIGSLLVAAGIACMFYMRAYFNRRPANGAA